MELDSALAKSIIIIDGQMLGRFPRGGGDKPGKELAISSRSTRTVGVPGLG